MRSLLLSLCLITFSLSSLAQKEADFKDMLLNGEKELYALPEESIKIADHLIQNSEDNFAIIKGHLLKGRALYVMANFENSVKAILEAKKLAELSGNLELQYETTVFGIHILELFKLDLAAEKSLEFTSVLAQDNMTSQNSLYFKGAKELINANAAIAKKDFYNALKNLDKAKSLFKSIPNQQLVHQIEILEIENFNNAFPPDIAIKKLNAFLSKPENEEQLKFHSMIALNKLGELLFQQKKYSEANDTYKKALALSEKLKNEYYKYQIIENVAINYMATGDSESFISYKSVASQLANNINIDEDNAVNAVFNYANANHTAKRDVVKATYLKTIIILSGTLFIIIVTWFLLKIRYRSRTKQYLDFLNYFELREKNKVIKKQLKPIVSKSLNIPKETESLLIEKLDRFEQSTQFTKQDMSLALLASQFDTNTKYLSETINGHKNKNFNSYINDLRINYIIDKLTTNTTYLHYKISYLAEESGFSSHSSFTTVFKSVTGIAPTIFINVLKNNKKSSLELQES